MKMLEANGLLWESQQERKEGVEELFSYWIAENIRKTRPNVPDGAIDKIMDGLKRLTLLLLKLSYILGVLLWRHQPLQFL